MKVNYLANRYFTDGQFQCYEFRSSKVMDESPHFIEIELKSTTQKKKKKKNFYSKFDICMELPRFHISANYNSPTRFSGFIYTLIFI